MGERKIIKRPKKKKMQRKKTKHGLFNNSFLKSKIYILKKTKTKQQPEQQQKSAFIIKKNVMYLS